MRGWVAALLVASVTSYLQTPLFVVLGHEGCGLHPLLRGIQLGGHGHPQFVVGVDAVGIVE